MPMTCRACGAQIADKAIVCYRCGASTSDPAAAQPRPSRFSVGFWTLIVALLALMTAAGLEARVAVGGARQAWSILSLASVLIAARAVLRRVRRR